MKPYLFVLALAVLGACATTPGVAPPDQLSDKSTAGTIEKPLETASVREHVTYAIQLLDAGRTEEGKTALETALARSPKDATALHLLRQIKEDPILLLGEPGASHVVVKGDTMSALAAHYLGDPMLFLALSRYNNLPAPNALAVGRTLNIPRNTKMNAAAATPPAAPPASSGNTALASATRLKALELLNAGEVDRAIGLLTEAQAMEPANSAIRKDLERARRVKSALAGG